MKALSSSLLLCLWLTQVLLLGAQAPQVYSPELHSLRSEMNGRQVALPLLSLRGEKRVEVSFDLLTPERRRLVYRLEHCNYRWQPTEGIFEQEAVESVEAFTPIEGIAPSRNTTQPYTHYSLSLPNGQVRPLISGNFRLLIYDDADTSQPLAALPLAVCEDLVPLSAQVSSNTDVDWDEGHQQVSLSAEVAKLQAHKVEQELHLWVLQNERWDNAVCDVAPTQLNGTQVLWRHQRELIFPAGNEYRRFEWLSTQHPGLHMERVQWIAPLYHATLQPDRPLLNYAQVEDQNGISVLRTTDNPEADTEADYGMVHFSLSMPEQADEVYVDGLWAQGTLAPPYRMSYDPQGQCYRAALFLKQGYYSYRYVSRPRGQKAERSRPIDGNHYQSSNDYLLLLYHRSPRLRHDRLVGVLRVPYKR